MHHFILPSQDTWISSGSSTITGDTFKDQNFGQDEILELKKFFYNNQFDHQTRILVQFNLTELSQSVANNTITNPKYFLRLYEANGTQDLSTNYTIAALPLSESWDEGRGKLINNPKITNGCSWDNRTYPDGGTATAWTSSGGHFITGSKKAAGVDTKYVASQSFSYTTPDINMDVTDIVSRMITSGSTIFPNYGFLLKFSGSQETDSSTHAQLKFFSKQTNTIYAPKLEVRWDDHTAATGDATGSLTALTMSGAVENYVYQKSFRNAYRENEKVKFRFGTRKQYIQKSFSTSVQTVSGSYIPEGSGSYSILDVATGETIVPFSSYTTMSCDSTSPYFIQWLDGFYPDRVYKTLIKIRYNDGQEVIYDDDFEFKIVR